MIQILKSWIFFILIGLVGCNPTPETIIKREIKHTIFSNKKIDRVEIIDTIYQRQVELWMSYDSGKIETIQKDINHYHEVIREIRKYGVRNELDEETFHSLSRLEFLQKLSEDRLTHLQQLYFYAEPDYICGYFIKVYYRDDFEPDEYAITNNFNVVCRRFILDENAKPPNWRVTRTGLPEPPAKRVGR